MYNTCQLRMVDNRYVCHPDPSNKCFPLQPCKQGFYLFIQHFIHQSVFSALQILIDDVGWFIDQNIASNPKGRREKETKDVNYDIKQECYISSLYGTVLVEHWMKNKCVQSECIAIYHKLPESHREANAAMCKHWVALKHCMVMHVMILASSAVILQILQPLSCLELHSQKKMLKLCGLSTYTEIFVFST